MIRTLAAATLLLAVAHDAAARQEVVGRIEGVHVTSSGYLVAMRPGSRVSGMPPACGAQHSLTFRVERAEMRDLINAAAVAGREIFIAGSEWYCGPFDPAVPEQGVQVAEIVSFEP